MKLFGRKSWSSVLHVIFKIPYLLGIIIGVVVLFHFLMAGIDYMGISNPFASLKMSPTGFDIHYKFLMDRSIPIPLKGISGFLNYAGMMVFSLATIIFFTRFLSQIFLCFSKETLFVKSLVKNTKLLAWVLIIMALHKVIIFTDYQPDYGNIIIDIFTNFFAGVMIWFLSKVFEEAHTLQQEIDLTI